MQAVAGTIRICATQHSCFIQAGTHATRSSGTPSGTVENCLSVNSGYACVSSDLVCRTANGSPLPQFACSGSLKCCSVAPQRELCSTLNGKICASNEQCSGTSRESADGSCCLERCEAVAPVEDACAQSNGVCSLSCDPDTETEGSEQCPLSGDVCCISKSEESSGDSNWLVWTIILIILIVLVALAIAYRKKLQLLLFKSRRSGVSSTPLSTTRRPPFPQQSILRLCRCDHVLPHLLVRLLRLIKRWKKHSASCARLANNFI